MRTLSYLSLTIIGSAMILVSCNKVEGPGGSSAITGNLSGLILTNSGGNSAELEVTTVTCTHADGVGGSILDNSDYFLLNTPNGGTYYYVWYENTNWPGQDPGLSGRTGIRVSFSNTETNVAIAIKTAAAISTTASADFSVAITNDIVTLTNLTFGEVPDADDINTPFAIDVSNQGQSATGATASSIKHVIADERVYIKYGDEDFYSESVRTDANGDYQFKGLTEGDYTIYAMSVDTLNAGLTLVEVAVEATITDKKQVVVAPDLFIVKD